MDVVMRGKFLIGAVVVLGLALSACAAPGPGAGYANGYYDYPGYYPNYYDPGYTDSFGFVGRDRDHDRRHDHDRDAGNPHEMHGGDYTMHDRAAGMPITHGFGGGASGFGGVHSGGERSFGGEHGGGGGGRR